MSSGYSIPVFFSSLQMFETSFTPRRIKVWDWWLSWWNQWLTDIYCDWISVRDQMLPWLNGCFRMVAIMIESVFEISRYHDLNSLTFSKDIWFHLLFLIIRPTLWWAAHCVGRTKAFQIIFLKINIPPDLLPSAGRISGFNIFMIV